MTTNTHKESFGYYDIEITSYEGDYIVSSNSERSFIVTQLQDILGFRSYISDDTPQPLLATYIDLLAYSITRSSIQLIVFALTETAARNLASQIISQLENYTHTYLPVALPQRWARVKVRKLAGPHESLHLSVALHVRHEDWEYDRYSSIGFYLHDRRGGWMRIWRLSTLFDNDPAYYRQLIAAELARTQQPRNLAIH